MKYGASPDLPPPWDRLWVGGHVATLAGGVSGFGEILDGAVAASRGRIAWVGPRKELPAAPTRMAREVCDLGGRWVTPGLVDCHTHLIFAGDRAGEFEERLGGASYQEIAARGGGILRTLEATRRASEEELFQGAWRRLKALQQGGVTTVEVKSGYGQDLETELRMLRVARRLGAEGVVEVQATLLAAHVLPPEFREHRRSYLELVVREMIPRVVAEGLAQAVDVFCDRIAFSPRECEEILLAAKRAGLALRIHADQLTDMGAAELAARLGSRTADHLEYASPAGVMAMARAGTVAVLLPGAYHVLGETVPPPVAAFRAAGVPMAVATDLNPGSSPLASLPLALNLACVRFGLTPVESLRGATLHGARALGLDGDRGSLEPGKRADLVIWEVGHPREIPYWMGLPLVVEVIRGGQTMAF